MLDRFVFIGTGGSGGRTLRFLRSNIQRRLTAYGYFGELPEAWQFLHIDVPARPDVGDAGDDQGIQYLGLTVGGEDYRRFDSQLALKGEDALRNFASWRPDPSRLPINPDKGAGQYRAAGRVIALSALPRLAAKLRETVNRANNAEASVLADVARAVGTPGARPNRVWTILVSSLGGGSGAGMYLDVCDILRFIDDASVKDLLGFFYTPDIFEDIPTEAKKALDPNTLAALSELIASSWNHESPVPDEFALITSDDVLVPNSDMLFRGPAYSFLVSRTNGGRDGVTFQTQADVYRAVAAALGALVTQPNIQDHFAAVTLGNWASLGPPTDQSGMTEGENQPFNSIGYGSLSLGRERFATYASQRFAGELASHLLFAHHSSGEPRTDAAVLEDLAQGYRDIFLREAGLMEFGPSDNQVLDVLRGGDFRSIAEPLAEGEKDSVLTSVTHGRSEVERESFRSALTDLLRNRKPAFASEQRERREQNAQKWVHDVQQSTLAAMKTSLVYNGGYGTVAVMELAAQHLRNEVVPGLRDEAATLRKQAQSKGSTGIEAIFAGAAKKLRATDARLKQVVQGSLSQWIGESEDALSSLAASLVSDLVDHFLDPLAAGLKRALQSLENEYQGQPGRHSPLQRWASGVVSDDLLPTQYEIFLESNEKWEDLYDVLIQKQTNSEFSEEARRALISSAISSDGDHWIGQTGAWVPPANVLIASGGPTTARFTVDLRRETIRRLAESELRKPNGEFQRYVRESIGQWLTPDESLDERRLTTLLAGLRDTQRRARPLVSIDEEIRTKKYGGSGQERLTRLVTPIPLDRSHAAAADIVRLLQEDFAFTDSDIDAAFDPEHDAPSLDVITTLQGPVSPLVITSVTAPIASAFQAHRLQFTAAERNQDNFWFGRRSRPLMSSIPVPPHLRRAYLRGWMIGRALGLIDVSDLDAPRIWDSETWHTFATLLGRRPEHARHVLPSVLEGVQLALVRRPTDEDVWLPYATLAELGRWTRDDSSHLAPSAQLANWLQTGSVGSGLEPQGDLASASTKEARSDALDAWLAKTSQAYEALSARRPTTSWQKLDRSWEISSSIVHALQQLRSSLAEERDVVDGPEN
jgi:hypothetical protein